MQGLGGLAPGLNRGATMSGNKGGSDSGTHGVKLLRAGGLTTITATFTASSAGLYEVALWGAGGVNNSTGGGAGGLAVRRVRLFKDEQLPYVIAPGNDLGTSSTVTFRDGVMTALSPTADTGAGASGPPDGIYQTGANGSGGLGGQAPSYGGLTGGSDGSVPGGGGNGSINLAAAGMIVITKVGD